MKGTHALGWACGVEILANRCVFVRRLCMLVEIFRKSYVTAADLDGDDDLDVVSAGYQDGRFVWYENTDGAGTFAAGQDIDLLDSARSVVAADLDGDGDVDLVACDQVGGRIVWYENTDGLGSFSAAIDIALDVGVNEVRYLVMSEHESASRVQARF